MHATDWIQVVSVVAVAVALVINTMQLRNSTQQTALATRALEQGVHDLRANAVTQISAMLLSEPEVLAWHLRARGYPEWAIDDRRTMYALLRLQIHEQSHLDTVGKESDPHTQGAWAEALKRDMSDAFYRRLWPTARTIYAPSFAAVVDEIIATSTQRAAEAAGEAPEK